MNGAEASDRGNIEATLRTLVSAAIAHVDQKHGSNVPCEYVHRWIEDQPGSRSSRTEAVRSTAIAVGDLRSEEIDTVGKDDVSLLVEAISRQPGFERYVIARTSGPPLSDRMRHSALRVIGSLAQKVCSPTEYRLDEELWRREFSELWRFLSEGQVEVRTYAPLLGLTCLDEVDLHGIVLRQLSDREQSRLLSSGTLGAGHAQTCVEIAGYLPFEDQSYTQMRTGHLVDLIAALRIWTGHRVVPLYIRSGQKWPHGSEGGTTIRADFVTPVALQDPMAFRQFWGDVRSSVAQPPGALRVALARFQIMNDHPRHSDRILDQMILFEALFLNEGDEKQELGYRLRMRAAHFLGDSLDERISIEKLLKQAYTLRSKIAHGSALGEGAAETHSRMDALTCKLLRLYLIEAGKRRDPKLERRIVDEMDRRMLERTGAS